MTGNYYLKKHLDGINTGDGKEQDKTKDVSIAPEVTDDADHSSGGIAKAGVDNATADPQGQTVVADYDNEVEKLYPELQKRGLITEDIDTFRDYVKTDEGQNYLKDVVGIANEQIKESNAKDVVPASSATFRKDEYSRRPLYLNADNLNDGIAGYVYTKDDKTFYNEKGEKIDFSKNGDAAEAPVMSPEEDMYKRVASAYDAGEKALSLTNGDVNKAKDALWNAIQGNKANAINFEHYEKGAEDDLKEAAWQIFGEQWNGKHPEGNIKEEAFSDKYEMPNMMEESAKANKEAGREFYTSPRGSEQVLATNVDMQSLESAAWFNQEAKWLISASEGEEKRDKGFSSGLKGLGLGLVHGLRSVVHGGVMDVNEMAHLVDVKSASDRLASGKATADDDRLLDSYINYIQAQQVFGKKKGYCYNLGESAAQSAPFMLEFILNPLSGAGNAAIKGMSRKLIQRFGTEYIKQNLKSLTNREVRAVMERELRNAIGKQVGKYLGKSATKAVSKAGAHAADLAAYAGASTVSAGAMTLTSGLPGVYADAIKRQLNDNEKKGEATYKAVMSAMNERGSEFAGPLFTPLLKFIGKTVSGFAGKLVGAENISKFASAVTATYPVSAVRTIISDVAKTGSYRNVSNLVKRAHFDGVFEEDFEEKFGSFCDALFIGDQHFLDKDGNIDWKGDNSFFNLKERLDETINVGFVSLLLGMGAVSGYRTPKYQLGKDLNAYDAMCSSAFGDNWEGFKDTIDNATPEQLSSVLVGVMQGGATQNQMQLLTRYAMTKARLDAAVEMEQGDRYNNENTPEVETQEAYDNGYTLDGQERNDAKNALEDKEKVLTPLLHLDSEEQVSSALGLNDDNSNAVDVIKATDERTDINDYAKQRIIEYVNSRLAMQGTIDAAKDDIDAKIQVSDHTIDSQADDNGMVRQATLRDGTAVYIRSGNVTIDDNDNNVVTSESDNTLVVQDQVTGKLQMVPATDILSINNEASADQLKAEAANTIRFAEAKKHAQEIDGVLPFNVGDVYDMEDKDGKSLQIQVLGDLGNGNVNVNWNGTNVSVPASQIQSLNESYNRKRYEVWKANREQGQNKDAAKPAEEETKSALSQIPVDQNGTRQYLQAQPTTAYDALVEATGSTEGTEQVVQAEMAKAKKALDEAMQMKPEGNTTDEIVASARKIFDAKQKAQEQYNRWNAVSMVPALREQFEHMRIEAESRQNKKAINKAVTNALAEMQMKQQSPEASRFNELASSIEKLQGEEKKAALEEMSQIITTFMTENGYEAEVIPTIEEFMNNEAIASQKEYIEEALSLGEKIVGFYYHGKVYLNVEHMIPNRGMSAYDIMTTTLVHESVHEDNDTKAGRELLSQVEDAIRNGDISQREALDIIEAISGSSDYAKQASEQEKQGKDATNMVADELMAHMIQAMSLGVPVESLTKNGVLTNLINEEYERRERIRSGRADVSKRSANADNVSEGRVRGSEESPADNATGEYRPSITSAGTEEETVEEQEIAAKAQADGTYLKAPNGETSKLAPKQWAQVRTKAFKKWFGDWEKAARIEKLRKSEPIQNRYNGEYGLNRDEAKQWVLDNVRGEYTNKDTNEMIAVSKVGVNEVTSHGSMAIEHLKSLHSIPDMIEKSIFIDEIPNEKGNGKYDSYRYYVCGLKIDDVDYTVKIVVGVKDGNKYYDHHLTEMEKGALIDHLNGLSNSVAEKQNSNSFGKDTKLLSILQTNSSKIVDENGEPLVLIHNSTVEGITEFRQGLGHGIYFADAVAQQYVEGFERGKNNYEVFLNIKNPYTETYDSAYIDEDEGVDGVFVTAETEKGIGHAAIVSSPNQIKSATDNIGTFDTNNNDIRYSISDAVAEGNADIADASGEIVAETNADRNVLFSTTTFLPWTDNLGRLHEGTRAQVLNYMSANGYSEAEVAQMRDTMDYWQNYISKIADFVNPDGSIKFKAFHKWNMKQPQYKTVGKKVENVVSTNIKNGEYAVNQELSTDCIKREAFTKLVNTLIARGADLSMMGPAQINTIKNMMRKYGIQVACDLCFVEGKRLQIVNWAQTIVNDWNSALEAIGLNLDELDDFNFGGYAYDADGNLVDDATFVPTEEYANREQFRAINEAYDILTGHGKEHYDAMKKRNAANWNAWLKANNVAESWEAKHKGMVWSEDFLTAKQKKVKKTFLTDGVDDPKKIYRNSQAYANRYAEMEKEYLQNHPEGVFEPNAKQQAELGKIRNKEIKTVYAKMQRLIAEYPEMRKKMKLGDLLGSKGLMQIRQENGEAYAQLWSLILGRFGSGTPKPIQDAVPYSGEVFEITDGLISQAYVEGGARMFSFSDFDITKVFDIMQIYWDMAARRMKLQSYTKEAAYVIMFGKTGAKINMSTLPKAVVSDELQQRYDHAKNDTERKVALHEGMENAGLVVGEDGTIKDLSWSEEHSLKPDFCQQIFRDPERNGNCGAVTVGASVNHCIYSAAQPWIRMVIPFHLSGMPVEARRRTDVKWYFDNTAHQNTRVNIKGNWVSINSPKLQGYQDYNFYATENDENWDMRSECRNYLMWCEENGYTPRFEWGINSEHYKEWCANNGYEPNQQIVDIMDNDMTDGVWNGYYKFITDFNAYKPVLDKMGNPTFDEEGHLVETPARHTEVTTNIALSDAERKAVFGDMDGTATEYAAQSVLQNRENSINHADANMNKMAAEVMDYLDAVRRNREGEISDVEVEQAEADMAGEEGKFFNSANDAELLMEAEKGNAEDISPEAEDYPLFSVVTDKELINRLENEKKVPVYRSMQLIDGKLYPPMSAKVDGKLREPTILGQWEQAEENPDMADDKGYFKLDKGNGKSLKARYNPYIHTSRTMLNDQFAEAQDRDNLVVVKLEVPESELTSGYKAEKAMDSVGTKLWKAGVIQAQLTGKREVILTRWAKPVEIVDVKKVAENIKEQIKDAIDVMPTNVVSPQQREALEAIGVKFVETNNKGEIKEGENAGKTWTAVYGKKAKKSKGRFSLRTNPETNMKSAISAMQKIANGADYVANAVAREDLEQYGGDKNIGFYWGKTGDSQKKYKGGYGLSHIGAKHGPEVVRQILDVLCNGKIDRYVAGNKTAVLTNGKFECVVALTRNGDKESWLLTGWDKIEKADGNSEVSTQSVPMQGSPTFSRTDLGAALSSANVANSSDTANNSEGNLQDTPKLSITSATDFTNDISEKGLQGMLGKEAGDKFTEDLYMNNADIRKEINKGIANAGYDYKQATRNWLGNIADSNVTPEQWHGIRTAFQSMLRDNGINAHLTDGDIAYALWKEAHPGNDIFAQAKDIATQMDMGAGRFSVTGGNFNPGLAQDEYNRMVSAKGFAFVEAWQDAMVSAKALQDAIAEETGPIADSEDVYHAENRMYGSSKNEAEYYEDNYLNPLLEAVDNTLKQAKKSGYGIDYNGLMDYLMAKHGIERNSFIALKAKLDELQQTKTDAVNKKMKAKAEKDYQDALNAAQQAGLTGLALANAVKKANAERRKADRKAELTSIKEGRKYRNDIYDNYIHDADLVNLKNDYENRVGNMKFMEFEMRKRAIMEKYAKGTIQLIDQQGDKAGLSAVMDDDTDYEKLAFDFVDNVDSKVDTKHLWDCIRSATGATLTKIRESGRMTKAAYDYVNSMFDFYVPLRGWDETSADEVYEYENASRPVFTPTLKKMFGRKSKAENPIAYIGNNAVSEIVIGNKNLMKQYLLRMAQNHPTSALSVSEVWYENVGTPTKPQWVERAPNITEGMSASDITTEMDRFKNDMETKRQQGLAKRSNEKLSVGMPITRMQEQEHRVDVMVDGKQYAVFVNGNPKAAQAINGTNKVNVDFHLGDNFISRANRFISEALTSNNPAFVPANFIRDMLGAHSQVYVKENGKYIKNFEKNVARIVAPRVKGKRLTGYMPYLLRQWKADSLDMNDEVEKYFSEFMTHGGETGYVNMLGVDAFKEEIEKKLNSFHGHAGKNAWHAVLDTVEFYNRAVEDATRFVTYMTSRQQGRSIDRAIDDAKTISLNFNRKGSGKKGNALLRKTVIFVNPAIQALDNQFKLITQHPARFAGLIAMYIMRGMAQAPVNDWLINMFGDDDDKDAYYNIPEWTRRNNFILYIPGTHNFFKIPLSQEFRLWHGLGETITGVAEGRTKSNPAMELALSMAGLLPVDPTANEGNPIANLMPTVLKPVYEITENTNFLGMPIYNDNDSEKYEPEFQRVTYGTPSWMVKASEGLNTLTGGDDHTKGFVEDALEDKKYFRLLTNPSVWNHLLGGYLGGPYNVISQTVGVGTDLVSGDGVKLGNVPVVSRFMARPIEKENVGKMSDDYWSDIDDADKTNSRYSHWKKDLIEASRNGDQEKADEIMGKLMEIATGADYRKAKVVDAYNQPIQKLRKLVKTTVDEETKRMYNQQIQMLVERLDEQLKAMGEDVKDGDIKK